MGFEDKHFAANVLENDSNVSVYVTRSSTQASVHISGKQEKKEFRGHMILFKSKDWWKRVFFTDEKKFLLIDHKATDVNGKIKWVRTTINLRPEEEAS